MMICQQGKVMSDLIGYVMLGFSHVVRFVKKQTKPLKIERYARKPNDLVDFQLLIKTTST